MLSRTQLLITLVISVLVIWLVTRRSSEPPLSRPKSPKSGKEGKPAFRQRLVAVGDLHGDIHNARKVLRMASIIDDNDDWVAGTDIFVQTGDIVDRGTYALDIYRLMQKLRGQASGVGGEVVSILGNHEIMNAIGDWRYVSDADIKQFGTSKDRQDALSVNGWLGQEWLANYSSTALVSLGDHASAPSYSFTHGSLRPTYPNLLPYPSAINDLGHSLLTKALTPPMALPYPPHPYSGLPKGSTQEEAELYDAGGPYWWRGLAESRDERLVCQWAGELKSKLGVRRVIGGHTPNFERIVDRCDGSIIIIDTGISTVYGGVLSALEIVYTLTPVKSSPGGNGHDHRQDPFVFAKGTEYIEREEVHAIYERRKHQIAIEERTIML